MPLPRSKRVIHSGEERRREIEQPSCMMNVTSVIVFGSEKPLGHAEVGAAGQEADLVCGLAQSLGRLEQAVRHIKRSPALGRVEDRRRLVGLTLGGVEDRHSRHELNSSMDGGSGVSLATNTSLS
jgi:hypothetical protein